MNSHYFVAGLRALGCLAIGAVAWAQAPNQKTEDILRQARVYQFQFRAGQTEILPQYRAMLEEATSAQPDNADLWNAMGVAYLAQGARALMPGGNPADALPAIQKGPAALERALQLNPNHAEALATHGGMQALMSSFLQMPQMAAKGVAEMNRAVELAPDSTRVRLQRAFSGLSLPDTLRNNAAEAEDLDFLIKVAGSSRAGSYIQIMRGDLYSEMGKADLARALYQTVEKSATPAAAEAKARLTAMDQGEIPASDIKALRSAAGSKCVLCHGN